MVVTANTLSHGMGVHSLTRPGETEDDVVRRCISELRQALSAQRRLRREGTERVVPPSDVVRWLRRNGLAR